MFAHQVIEGHAQGQMEVVVEEVEGAAADEGLDLLMRDRMRVVLVVAVADQSRVRVDLDHQMLVDVVHTHATVMVVVAGRQGHGDGDLFDVADLHVTLLL